MKSKIVQNLLYRFFKHSADQDPMPAPDAIHLFNSVATCKTENYLGGISRIKENRKLFINECVVSGCGDRDGWVIDEKVTKVRAT